MGGWGVAADKIKKLATDATQSKRLPKPAPPNVSYASEAPPGKAISGCDSRGYLKSGLPAILRVLALDILLACLFVV